MRGRGAGVFLIAVFWVALFAPTATAEDPAFLGKSLSKWVGELGSNDAGVRRNAAFALGKIGPAAFQAVPKLVRALKDKNASVREATAGALGEIGPSPWEGTLPALFESLASDADPHVKRSAAAALGKLGKQLAVSDEPSITQIRDALVKALADVQPAVRQNAACALGQLGPKRSAPALPRLIAILNDTDPLVRRDAAGALREFGPDAQSAVHELLRRFKDDKDSEVRKSALNALVNIVGPQNKDAASDLRAGLQDSDAEIVRGAALALANIGGREGAAAVPVLCNVLVLQERDPSARRQAAAALGHLGPDAEKSVGALAGALSDRDPVVRRNAAVSLAHIGSKAAPAVSALTKMFEGREPDEVRMYAAEALAHISPAVETAIPTLLRVLKQDSNWRVRQRAVWALSRLENPERAGVFGALAAVLSETDADTRILRYECAVILGDLQGTQTPEKAIDLLQALLNDKDVLVYSGAEAKVKSAGAEARGPDAGVTPIHNGDPRWMAAQSLGRIGKKANRPEIIRSLKEAAEAPDARVRDSAREALRKVQD